MNPRVALEKIRKTAARLRVDVAQGFLDDLPQALDRELQEIASLASGALPELEHSTPEKQADRLAAFGLQRHWSAIEQLLADFAATVERSRRAARAELEHYRAATADAFWLKLANSPEGQRAIESELGIAFTPPPGEGVEEAPAPTSPTTRELLVLEERIRRLEERHGLRLSTPPPNKPSKQGVPPPEDPR